LNNFVTFVLEALVLSIIDVVKTSVEVQRSLYLRNLDIESKIVPIIRPLVKQGELQYKKLWKIAKKKITNKTFATYLQEGVSTGYLRKREQGRNVYYSLNVEFPEEKMLNEWMQEISKKLIFIPDDYKKI
jgi:hypothetical protein